MSMFMCFVYVCVRMCMYVCASDSEAGSWEGVCACNIISHS